MRILLISPKRALSKNETVLHDLFASQNLPTQDDMYTGSGLGLLIVAALTPADIDVEFVDESFQAIDYGQPADLVAISAMTCQAVRAYEIAGNFRARGVKVMMGGIHATLLPEEASRYCDSVAAGEAEVLWPEIIDDLRRGELKPLYQASTVSTASPVPRYDLLKGQPHDIYWISTTRGCPFSCVFCCSSRIFGTKYRFKPVDQVINELEKILEVHGPRKPKLICFADDNMLVDRKRAFELAERIKPYKIKWFAQTDLSVAQDETLLSTLKDSGCVMLFMGLETLGTNKLRALGNHLKANAYAKYPEIIETIHSHGIAVLAAFIIGLDEDTPEVFDEMIEFIKSTHLVAIQISILTPLPGTPLRDQLEKEKRILPTDWSRHNMTEVNFLPKRMTVEQLAEGYLKIYREGFNTQVLNASKKHFLMLSLQRARRMIPRRDA